MTDHPLHRDFLLDPEVTFLNHGSFGACPKPVFEQYQNWQLELERQPVEFLGRRYNDMMDHARDRLAAYINADSDSIIFVPNATTGINVVGRSLKLQPGDEILTTDHEYGALDLMWQYVSRETGASYIKQTLPLPVDDAEILLDAFWEGVTPNTKIIYLSHITSSTALILPVQMICQRARSEGIMTIVDGAHAPGQIDLDMQAIDADFYAGNCHKWLCAPKGSAFLYARSDQHPWIDPLVISWGWYEDGTFVSRNQWQGTRDVAAFLSVPAAIDFQAAHDWPTVRQNCHQLAQQTRQRLLDFSGLIPPSADSPEWYAQMVAVPLPDCDAAAVKERLYDEYRIEVPVYQRDEQVYTRVSYQAYNSADDVDTLVNAFMDIFGWR